MRPWWIGHVRAESSMLDWRLSQCSFTSSLTHSLSHSFTPTHRLLLGQAFALHWAWTALAHFIIVSPGSIVADVQIQSHQSLIARWSMAHCKWPGSQGRSQFSTVNITLPPRHPSTLYPWRHARAWVRGFSRMLAWSLVSSLYTQTCSAQIKIGASYAHCTLNCKHFY